jgi:hypothetical protein
MQMHRPRINNIFFEYKHGWKITNQPTLAKVLIPVKPSQR